MNLFKNMTNLIHNGCSMLLNSPSLHLVNKYNIVNTVVRNLMLVTVHKRREVEKKRRKQHKVLMGKPFAKGVILKNVIKNPRKPNSANRKCVLVKLSNGKTVLAYVPGVGHNLQEHQFVLVNGKKLKDVPGVKVRCVRGVYDLPHVGNN